MGMEDDFLIEFGKNFSKTKSKKVHSLAKRSGLLVATALYGGGNTSDPEVNVIASLLQHFDDIELYAYKMNPNKVILKAKTYTGHPVLIHPQYRIPKPLRLNEPNTKRQYYWNVDLVVEIYDQQTESIVIGIWAMEYDGCPTHFLESGIKKDRYRDVVINTETDINCIHITKEKWERHSNEYVTNMLRYIERRTRDASFMSQSELKLRDINLMSSPELEVIYDGNGYRATSWEFVTPEENT